MGLLRRDLMAVKQFHTHTHTASINNTNLAERIGVYILLAKVYQDEPVLWYVEVLLEPLCLEGILGQRDLRALCNSSPRNLTNIGLAPYRTANTTRFPNQLQNKINCSSLFFIGALFSDN